MEVQPSPLGSLQYCTPDVRMLSGQLLQLEAVGSKVDADPSRYVPWGHCRLRPLMKKFPGATPME
jgi:hypothetical protein